MSFNHHIQLLFCLFFSLTVYSQEVCNNGIDDDSDGLIDLNDPQCVCTGSGTGQPTSLIPNASFEDMLCCPTSFGEMYCADQWLQASEATSDYMNTCNFVMPAVITQGGLLPFPDGDAICGFIILEGYKEYIGACLTSPMTAGTSYTLQLNMAFTHVSSVGDFCTSSTTVPPITMTVFGAPSCGNIPYGGVECPAAPFVPIGSITYTPVSSWQVITFTFTPTFNVAEIVLGAPCTLPVGFPDINADCYPYYLADALIINTSDSFEGVSITMAGQPCQDNVVLNASTGNMGGTWQWYEDGVAIVGQTSASLNVSALGLDDGDYTVSYTVGSDCATADYTVDAATSMSLTVNDATICSGQTATLTANCPGATSFTWSPATGLNTTTGSTVQASPAVTTPYQVTATAAGCTATATATVTVTPGLTIDVTDVTACEGQVVVLTATGADQYSWSPSTGLNTSTGTTVLASPSNTTVYTVTGTSANGCTGTGQGIVTIINSIGVSISASPNPVSADEPVVYFSGEPADADLTWYFGDSLGGSSNATNPVYEYPQEDGAYEVLLVGSIDGGCVDSAWMTIYVQSDLIFYVPNTFTPNGDEFNGQFQPVFYSGFDAYNFELLIYNRWGEILFESHDATKGWDGTYAGGLAPTGVYTWTLRFGSIKDSEDFEQQGHVNLIR